MIGCEYRNRVVVIHTNNLAGDRFSVEKECRLEAVPEFFPVPRAGVIETAPSFATGAGASLFIEDFLSQFLLGFIFK